MPPSWEPAGPCTARLFAEWEQQIGCHHLTPAGLHAIRLRLVHGGEFEPGLALDRMRLLVDDAIAAQLRVDPADLPGSPLAVPDDPGDLEDPGRRDWPGDG